jgi:hypothetical protein
MRLEVNLKGPAGLMRELVYRMGWGKDVGGGGQSWTRPILAWVEMVKKYYYSKNSLIFSGISGVLEARWVSHAMT